MFSILFNFSPYQVKNKSSAVTAQYWFLFRALLIHSDLEAEYILRDLFKFPYIFSVYLSSSCFGFPSSK